MARTKYTKVVARRLLVFLLSNFSMAVQVQVPVHVCILCLPFSAPYYYGIYDVFPMEVSMALPNLWYNDIMKGTTFLYYKIRVFGLWLGLRFTPGCVLGLFVFVLCLVYLINVARGVSVDCPFFIVPSIFSDLYFISNK